MTVSSLWLFDVVPTSLLGLQKVVLHIWPSVDSRYMEKAVQQTGANWHGVYLLEERRKVHKYLHNY